MPRHLAYLSLGSNLGDRASHLYAALESLRRADIRMKAQSQLYESAPQDFAAQPWFLNLCVAAETNLFPLQLLTATQRIERELGRRRDPLAAAKGPRIIDIDILLFDACVIHSEQLEVPHPRMRQRRFVLEPLLEIAPGLRDPEDKREYRESLAGVQAQPLRVYKGSQ